MYKPRFKIRYSRTGETNAIEPIIEMLGKLHASLAREPVREWLPLGILLPQESSRKAFSAEFL